MACQVLDANKLRAYLEICFPGRTMFDEQSVLSGLSHPLRAQIALHKARGVLQCLQVLHDDSLDAYCRRP